MTILLSGGSGFLGSHIAEQLADQGQAVRALVRKTSDTSFLEQLSGVELVEASLSDRKALIAAAEGVTAIIHCAGLVKARSEDDFLRVNVGGTENMLAAAAAHRETLQRFVLVSSQTAGGPSDAAGNPVDAESPARPVSAYGRSKRAAERVAIAQQDQLPITILRPPAIYGPRDREILAFFRALRYRLLPYMGSPDNKLSIIYGPDCAGACIAAVSADVPSGSIYYVDDGAVHTFRELVAAAEAALDTRAWVRFPLPERLVRAVALANEYYGRSTDRAVMLTRDKCNELFNQWVCDGSGARAAFGWEPRVGIREGFQLTGTWYRDHGWL